MRPAILIRLAVLIRLSALAALAGLCAGPGPAAAHEIRAGALVIHHPWTRATPSGAEVAGGYMTIENTGTQPERLIGGSLEGARGFELHSMSQSGGIMRMRPVAGGLDIPPGRSVTLAPAGLHIMFTGLKAPLVQDTELDGTLVFQHAGTVAIEVEVQGLGSRAPVEREHGHAKAGVPEMPSMPAMPGMPVYEP